MNRRPSSMLTLLLAVGGLAMAPSAPAAEALVLSACAANGNGHVAVRLRNTGAVPRAVLRPLPDWLAQLGDWGGWSLRIGGDGGGWLPYPFPGGVPPVSAADEVELAVAGDLRFELDVGGWMPESDLPIAAGKPVHRLAETSGRFHLDLSYQPPAGPPRTGGGTDAEAIRIRVEFTLPATPVDCAL